jgi:hypothetical protein
MGGVSPQAAAEAVSSTTPEKYVPPSSFVLLSRSKTEKYVLKNFNATIASKYDCYHQMHTPTKQDDAACKA